MEFGITFLFYFLHYNSALGRWWIGWLDSKRAGGGRGVGGIFIFIFIGTLQVGIDTNVYMDCVFCGV